MDNDDGHAAQETFLSSSRGRDVKDPATWSTLKAAQPWRLPDPEGLRAALLDGDRFARFDDPTGLFTFANTPQGYQYSPEVRSPEIVPLNLSAPPIATPGGVKVWALQSGDDPFLLTTRGGRLVDGPTSVECLPSTVHTFGGQPEIYFECNPSYRYLGAGMCGACPVVDVEIYGVDAAGALHKRGEDETSSECGDIEVRVDLDAGWITAWSPSCSSDAPPAWVGFTLRRQADGTWLKEPEPMKGVVPASPPTDPG